MELMGVCFLCSPLGRLGQPGGRRGSCVGLSVAVAQRPAGMSLHTPDVNSRTIAKVADGYTALARTRNPKRRLLLATQLLELLGSIEKDVSSMRDDAVSALRGAGASYAEIADLAGVNRSRVAQLAQRTTVARSRTGTV